MSKRNRGQRARVRRNKLVAARAELAILLENRLDKYHLQLNTHSTEKLLDHVREFHDVPFWAQRNYIKQYVWNDPTKWLPDDKADAFTYYGPSLDKLIKPST
jgi:hypothetical protein